MIDSSSKSPKNKKTLTRLPRGKPKQVVITDRDMAVLSWITIHGIVTLTTDGYCQNVLSFSIRGGLT